MEIPALKTTNTPLPHVSKKVLLKKLAVALVGMSKVAKLSKTAPTMESRGKKHPRARCFREAFKNYLVDFFP